MFVSVGKITRKSYCKKCGKRLKEIDSRTTVYDEYTGQPRKEGVLTLICPDFYGHGLGHTRQELSDDDTVNKDKWNFTKTVTSWDSSSSSKGITLRQPTVGDES